MSTRGIIARTTDHKGGFRGVYNHFDSYPRRMGPRLLGLLHDKYKGDLGKMLINIIDKHPAGWSQVGTECYCHPKRDREPEPADWRTDETFDRKDTDIEWLWVFDEEKKVLHVTDVRNNTDAGTVILGNDTDAEMWGRIECGQDLERCSHYAWVHFPELKGSNLTTQTWLGRQLFEFHDAYAFIVNGKRYKATGSGGHSDWMFGRLSQSVREEVFASHHPCWIASVQAKNGRRLTIPVASIERDRTGREGYRPYKGVTWVFPPTSVTPLETLQSA